MQLGDLHTKIGPYGVVIKENMELHTQVVHSGVHTENNAVESTAYDLHKLHPLKGAASPGANSPMGGSPKYNLKGRRRNMRGPGTPISIAYWTDTQRRRGR